jgi:hypothetical protein
VPNLRLNVIEAAPPTTVLWRSMEFYKAASAAGVPFWGQIRRGLDWTERVGARIIYRDEEEALNNGTGLV